MQKAAAVNADVKVVLDLYRGMLELREFELKVQELYRVARTSGLRSSLCR